MTTMYDSNAFRQQIRNVKNEINDITNSGKYYMSNDLKNEFNAIDDGLNHLHLEGTIQDTSANLKESVHAVDRHKNAKEIAQAVNNAATSLRDYKDAMCLRNFEGKQENQMRELHHWGLLALKDVQKGLTPHTYGSWKRLYDFKNDVGVTDMYTGFRNNVARPRQPCEPNSHWTGKPSVRFIETKSSQLRRPSNKYDYCRALSAPAGQLTRLGPPVEWTGDLSRSKLGHTLPPKVSTRGYKTIDSLYPRATVESRLEPPDNFHVQSVENLRLPDYLPKALEPNRQTWFEKPRSVQEQAGINMVFPGVTEYMDRFGYPETNRLGGGYIINPTPNFEIYGRPLMGTKFYPKYSEYQSRFDWPSGDKLIKFPWLRK